MKQQLWARLNLPLTLDFYTQAIHYDTVALSYNLLLKYLSFEKIPGLSKNNIPATPIFPVDHIFCISDPKRTDRRLNVQSIFDYLKMKVEYIPAINPEVDPLALEMSARTKSGLSPSAVGCWVAHLKVWRSVVEKGYGTILVLEDDIDISYNIERLLRKAISVLNSSKNKYYNATSPGEWGWDLLYPGHCSYDEDKFSWLDESFKQLRYAYTPICTHGYVASRSGAQKLIKLFSELGEQPVDMAIANNGVSVGRTLKIFSFWPPAINQRRDIYSKDPGLRDTIFLAPEDSTYDRMKELGVPFYSDEAMDAIRL
ncbi:hypothetical protein H4219_001531 [Mycoemilia scoparia]|uniref:Glycosyl transferase family 25 domain-containing protein n=1 Tax=Mycoemilia scoparia TaxID=417184 RepID=A0A9W8A5R5_9FUNG|nr:hypothetical protein H4219_001531 [Mycoemilia scoparia]